MWKTLMGLVVLSSFACGGGRPRVDGGYDESLEDAGPPPKVALGMNAVSVLFPLPDRADGGELLRLDALAAHGPLLPKAHFDAIPVFFTPGGGDPRAYEHWRVVAARIDPCFPTLAFLKTDPSRCRPQLRLVAQPLSPSDFGPPATEDDALHLLYELTPAELESLARRWVAPLQDAPGARTEALDVSPTLIREGPSGPYATLLKQLVLEHAGADRLGQLTFMAGRGVAWDFGGFRIQNGVRTPLPIFGVEPSGPEPKHLVTTISFGNGSFDIRPESSLSRALAPLGGKFIGNGTAGGGHVELDDATVPEALQRSLDVDNPRRAIHADTADCSSCHVANRARRAVERAGKADVLGLVGYSHRSRDLRHPSALDATPSLQRAFGYLGRQPVVNQRVINESAEVADFVERLVSQGN